jgi:hypothetical protein
MKPSYNELWDLLRSEIGKGKWVVEIYDDHFIYEDEAMNRLFRADYSIDESNQITIGSPIEVEKKIEYIPVQIQAAGKMLSATGEPESEDYGYKWRVQVVEYGMGKDGRINWPREPLAAAIGLYENAKVFALMDSQHQSPQKVYGKSVRELVGWLKNAIDTGTGIEADLFILKSAKWLRDALVDSHERGNPDLFGLSHDVSANAVIKRDPSGKSYKEPVEIVAVQVDVVYDPTNNGKFLRMAAAVGQGGDNDMFEKLMAGLAKARPDLHKEIKDAMDQNTLTEEQAIEKIMAAMVKDAGGDENNEKLVAALVDQIKTLIVDDKKLSPEIEEIKLLAAGMVLDRELEGSQLPDSVQADLRKHFEKKVFDVEDLKAAIVDAKKLVDDLTGSGNVEGAGGNGRIEVVRGGVEKLQAAFDGMMGVVVDEKVKDIKPMTGLRAAYVEMTGDTEVRGYLEPEQTTRLRAAYGSTTFSYVLGNTLYRRLVQDYREMSDMGVSRLVGNNIRNARDFRTMESIRIGYYGDLPDVDPEAEDYQDLSEVGDEEITYAINQKGGLITITRKMVINDDLRAVQKIVSRAPRAARRTLAKRCWTPFTSNATYKGDSKAIFHADHGNLGATAYGIASALAAKTAMAEQTEPDSGERLMLRPVTVSFPSELFGIVKNVNSFNPQAVEIANGNSMFGFFQDDGLFENPFMTDATDWLMFADPNDCEILELAYLNGQQEPEMFVADQNTVGQMFVADKIQYKIRHEYECEVVDYRGAYKAVVAD